MSTPIPSHQPRAPHDWIAHYAGVAPDKLACIDIAGDRRHTYGELDRRIARLAGGLQQGFGIGRGDRVALLSRDSTDVFEIQFACARLGAIFAPLNWRLARGELRFLVEDLQPRLLINDQQFGELADSLRRHPASIPGLETRLDGAASSYEKTIEQAPALAVTAPIDLDDPWCIMYTSGTTGRPKGAIQTHGMITWHGINCTAVGPNSITFDSVSLCALPLFHAGGLHAGCNPFFHVGATVLVTRDFDPTQILHLLSSTERGVTHFTGVPSLFQFMAACPEFDRVDFGNFSMANVGGAPVCETLLHQWLEKGVILSNGFGMTETGPGVMMMPFADCRRKIGSCGKPFLHTQVRVVDGDNRDLGPGEPGELLVKGPNVTPGYWNLPEATRAALVDGWFHTGDTAQYDDEGFYYIVGRQKDMYISGGENVYPAEIENVIYQLPEVLECAVFGVPDRRWQETGCAVVVAKPGMTLTANAIATHCKRHLAGFKQPRYIHFADQLPHNSTGKILKNQLRERLSYQPI